MQKNFMIFSIMLVKELQEIFLEWKGAIFLYFIG